MGCFCGYNRDSCCVVAWQYALIVEAKIMVGYCLYNGCNFRVDGDTLLTVLTYNPKKAIELPPRIRVIAPRAFMNLSIIGVIFGSMVEEIGDEAFMGCRYLVSLTVQSKIKCYGKDVFLDCGLSSIKIDGILYPLEKAIEILSLETVKREREEARREAEERVRREIAEHAEKERREVERQKQKEDARQARAEGRNYVSKLDFLRGIEQYESESDHRLVDDMRSKQERKEAERAEQEKKEAERQKQKEDARRARMDRSNRASDFDFLRGIEQYEEEAPRNKVDNSECHQGGKGVNPRVNVQEYCKKMAGLAPVLRRQFSEFSEYDHLIFFDTETSGLSPVNNKIIEFSAIIFDREAERYVSKLICLDGHLSGEVSLLTGIDDTLLAQYGEDRESAEQAICALFEEGRSLVIGYNLTFDLAFLREVMVKHGCTEWLDRHDYIDALTVFKDRAPYPHKLENACARYGVSSLGAHCSLYDSLALAEVSCAMQRAESMRRWINRFGYNPRYGVSTPSHVAKIHYFPQPYKNFF